MTVPPPPPSRTPLVAVLLMLALQTVVLLAGCEPGRSATAQPSQPTTQPTEQRIAASGACYLLDRALISEHLALELDVVAARSRGATHSCVQRVGAQAEPELVLTVTPTTVDLPTFVQDVTPPGATAVSRLGKAGYQGPGPQVGWLSGDDRLLVLTLTPPPGEDPDRYAGGLLELARAVDRARH
jgi:hypothetical protein